MLLQLKLEFENNLQKSNETDQRTGPQLANIYRRVATYIFRENVSRGGITITPLTVMQTKKQSNF